MTRRCWPGGRAEDRHAQGRPCRRPGALAAGCALVTATALFDLAGAGWLDAALAAALAADRLPLLSLPQL